MKGIPVPRPIHEDHKQQKEQERERQEHVSRFQARHHNLPTTEVRDAFSASTAFQFTPEDNTVGSVTAPSNLAV